MKKIFSVFAAALFFHTAMAQLPAPATPFPKTITVSGSAEMEIIPDEIYVNIELKEYQKKGEVKKDIEIIKTRFLQACQAAGIPDSAISILSYSGHNNYYTIRRKKKDTELFTSITYQVKFSSSRLMDALVEKLDEEATQNFLIVSTSHSRITEYRKQLKIKAIQAAKDKGIYLTEAIGEKLGEAITITEPAEWQPFFLANNMVSNGAYASNENTNIPTDAGSEIDFKKLRLRFEVTIIFALK